MSTLCNPICADTSLHTRGTASHHGIGQASHHGIEQLQSSKCGGHGLACFTDIEHLLDKPKSRHENSGKHSKHA